MAEAIRDVETERAAVSFDGGSLLVISLLFAALWATAGRARHRFKPEVSEQEIDALRRASRPNVGFYAGVTGELMASQSSSPSVGCSPIAV